MSADITQLLVRCTVFFQKFILYINKFLHFSPILSLPPLMYWFRSAVTSASTASPGFRAIAGKLGGAGGTGGDGVSAAWAEWRSCRISSLSSVLIASRVRWFRLSCSSTRRCNCSIRCASRNRPWVSRSLSLLWMMSFCSATPTNVYKLHNQTSRMKYSTQKKEYIQR